MLQCYLFQVRGQKKLEPRSDCSPLVVQFKFSGEHPHPYHMELSAPPPPPPWDRSPTKSPSEFCLVSNTSVSPSLKSHPPHPPPPLLDPTLNPLSPGSYTSSFCAAGGFSCTVTQLSPKEKRDCPLEKLREDWALAFNARTSGIVWVVCASYSWLTVTLETMDQLKLALLPKRSQNSNRWTFVLSLPNSVTIKMKLLQICVSLALSNLEYFFKLYF